MVEPSDVQKYIEDGLPCAFIKVVGDGHHFEAIIVSEQFVGKNRVQQHQLVYGALGDRMREEIHALSMKTFTPEKWETAKQQYGLGE
ncbi:MAG: BolA family transcriptional regulator [Deltaproteobacteria bacterium]|nr:BolA family transcriptional regulator [Deltaproteobacteria bacterium]|tara:strand:- start:9539 stop:9799 length:261 start_codon:yes stop_codon:yes gene_type:complete